VCGARAAGCGGVPKEKDNRTKGVSVSHGLT